MGVWGRGDAGRVLLFLGRIDKSLERLAAGKTNCLNCLECSEQTCHFYSWASEPWLPMEPWRLNKLCLQSLVSPTLFFMEKGACNNAVDRILALYWTKKDFVYITIWKQAGYAVEWRWCLGPISPSSRWGMAGQGKGDAGPAGDFKQGCSFSYSNEALLQPQREGEVEESSSASSWNILSD